jgi:hypothetical protein
MEHESSRRRLLINSWSDLEANAAALLTLYLEQEPIDVLITAIRDGRIERQWVWDIVIQLVPQQTVEVPLARVTGQRSDFNAAFADYLDRVEQLCEFILTGQPFML